MEEGIGEDETFYFFYFMYFISSILTLPEIYISINKNPSKKIKIVTLKAINEIKINHPQMDRQYRVDFNL